VDLPDDKSVMTYTMEYFLLFAAKDQQEKAAKQAAEWLNFLRGLVEQQNDYERRARIVVSWTQSIEGNWESFDFGSTKEEAVAAFNALRVFVTVEKPAQEGEKMDLEALFDEIQTTIKVNRLKPYAPPTDLMPEAIETIFINLSEKGHQFGNQVRNARFKFIEKKENKSSEEVNAQIEKSFKHYDTNKSGTLCKPEFGAALMEMGIALKTDEKNALFALLSEGTDEISYEQYQVWMVKRLVISLDDPESIKSAFKTMADGNGMISEAQLDSWAPIITDVEKAFMQERMEKNEDGLYDYIGFVSKMME